LLAFERKCVFNVKDVSTAAFDEVEGEGMEGGRRKQQ
jgi:hypothetical protein